MSVTDELSNLELTIIGYASRWLKNTRRIVEEGVEGEHVQRTIEKRKCSPEDALYTSIISAHSLVAAMTDLRYEENSGLSRAAKDTLHTIEAEAYELVSGVF